MKILDMTAGNRAIWFNKQHPFVTFVDIRKSVKPTIVADAKDLPFPNNTFDLAVFDPPHMNCGKKSNMAKVYGHSTTKEILNLVEIGSKEAARVCKTKALMALKWNNHDIKLTRVLNLMPHWEPLFGHLTKDGPGSQTYWVLLRVIGAAASQKKHLVKD